MRPDHCECGSVDLHQANVRVVGNAKRRQYHCRTCGTYFATLEFRVPRMMDSAVFQAKLRSLIAKEAKRGKAKAGKNEGSAEGSAIDGQVGGGDQHQDRAQQEAQRNAQE